jgi:hypothetical protein
VPLSDAGRCGGGECRFRKAEPERLLKRKSEHNGVRLTDFFWSGRWAAACRIRDTRLLEFPAIDRHPIPRIDLGGSTRVTGLSQHGLDTPAIWRALADAGPHRGAGDRA